MSDSDLKTLQQTLDSFGTKLSDIMDLLKGDKFGQPGLVSRVRLQDQIIEAMETKIRNQEKAMMEKEASYIKKLNDLRFEIGRVYWTAAGISSAVATVFFLLSLYIQFK